MRLRRIRALAATVAAGLGLAVPATSLADSSVGQGGVPQNGCPITNSQGTGPKHGVPSPHGQKCGFSQVVGTDPCWRWDGSTWVWVCYSGASGRD